MNAIIKQLSPDLQPVAERCLREFLGWHSESAMRRKIVDTYRSGWCDATFALETLIGLDLIEYTPGIADE